MGAHSRPEMHDSIEESRCIEEIESSTELVARNKL